MGRDVERALLQQIAGWTVAILFAMENAMLLSMSRPLQVCERWREGTELCK
jgi:hypothetical protein